LTENIEVALRDAYSAQGEEIVLSRCSHDVWTESLNWPESGISCAEYPGIEMIVAKVDGVVRGRALLRAANYPFVEFMGLEVVPAFRGRRLGSRIMDFAIRRASTRGFCGIYLAVEHTKKLPQGLYARRGFLPAHKDKHLLKMVRLLNYPAVDQFLWEHPLANFCSLHRQDCEGAMELSWVDVLNDCRLLIRPAFGSEQCGTQGLGLELPSVEIVTKAISFSASVLGPNVVSTGDTFEVGADLVNQGEQELAVGCRLLLNPGFVTGEDSTGAAEFSVAAGETCSCRIPVKLTETFGNPALEMCSWHSTPVCLELYIGEYVFHLVKQVRIAE
jgi:ribosomal protein S18 acetylase RimI-like enzyme